VAEVAGVSVDTVSRWENNRTPAVKRENAEALAQALEVEVDQILQPGLPGDGPAEPGADGDRAAPAPECRRPWAALGLAAVAGAALALGATTLWRSAPATPAPNVAATRRLPPYTPPGTEVPVTVDLRADQGGDLRVVLKEVLPPGWTFGGSSSPPDQGPAADGAVKWILHLERGEGRVAYLVRAPAEARESTPFRFAGEVVLPGGEGGREAVRGEARIDIEYVHWADQDADFQVSDAEVLAALERLEAARGLQGLDPADLRSLWGADQYTWDRGLGRFRPR
ncbi:MAG: helix-turn-helix domain-containing protein, partial [Deferrisomatales bacterium]